jgi:hypothetical protein
LKSKVPPPTTPRPEPEEVKIYAHPVVTKSKEYFPRVKEAREALKARAMELFELQVDIVKKALKAKDFETAADANQWLMEHMPADAGMRMIDVGIDKPKHDSRNAGPNVNIGFQLGGITKPEQKALPTATVIDVEPEETK